MSSAALAQPGVKGGVNDSSVIPSKRMPQQNEFWNGSYNFPAKPRNMWEVGVSTGIFTVSGDVTSKVLTYPNFDVHVRKAFGYVFSLRLQYMDGYAKGQSWAASENFNLNPAWNTNIADKTKRYFSPERLNNGTLVNSDHAGNFAAAGDEVYYNYKTHVQDLSVQGIITLNNIRFHKQKTGIVLYGGGGIGATIYKSMVNALDDQGNPYRTLFNAVFTKYGAGTYKDRKDILKDLKAGMDNTYETAAESDGGSRRPKLLGGTLKPSATVLAGVAIKLGRRINLAIEDRWTFVKDDLLDGQRWQEHAPGEPVLTTDFDSYNYGSIGLNFNLGAKSVEPLWWLNPLDYAYDELMNHHHYKPPVNNCPDTDGDGVCDHLDREPNTPAGCPVDTHGVSRDTDGDGVPDCLDQELITPTKCQPVDAHGVGKCPDPECCKPGIIDTPIIHHVCPCDYPTLTIKGLNLSKDNKTMLAMIAAKMKENPTCTITLSGYPSTSKASQAVCQKRLDAIRNYLVTTEGIVSTRIATNCAFVQGADTNVVDVKCNP